MKKIVILQHGFGLGGAEKMKLFLLRNIDREKYDIKICCIGEKGVLGQEMENLGCKIDELRLDATSLRPSITYSLSKYLKKERPDILHTVLFNANFHGRIAGFFSRVPHLITEEHGEHRWYKGIKFFPYILADFLLSRLNDFIICCSERLKEEIIKNEKLPPKKVISIENCLDIDYYTTKVPRDDIRMRHNISEEVVFTLVANLKAGKGHEYLIEALKEVKDAGYSFKCFFAGKGPLREILCDKCSKLGLSEEVIFLGVVENITDYLNASDVFVLPSFSEGLSIALMEGMLMGLGSIVTDVGSNLDLIKSGFNGIRISPGDKEGLKDAIISYLKDRELIREHGTRSRSIIESKYTSIKGYARKFHEIWDRCIDGKGPES